MASAKNKTTDTSPTNGVPAASADTASADTATPAATTDAAASGRKLRSTSLPPARGAAHRTRKPTANTPSTPKTEPAHDQAHKVNSDKLSALDAAAKVLQEAGQPMNCQELIKAMAAKGYWTSPAGKTPASTLYAAILRETKTKGSQARFQKSSRGQFVYHSPQAS